MRHGSQRPTNPISTISLEQVLDAVAVGIVVVDVSGRIVLANPKACSIFDLPLNQCLGRTFDDLGCAFTTLRGMTFPKEQMPFRRAIAARQSVRNVEVMFRQRGGTSTAVSMSATPIIDQDETVSHVVVSMVDITERIQIQREHEEVRVLSQAFGRISTGLLLTRKTDELLDNATRQASEALGSESAGTALWSEGRWLVAYAHGEGDRFSGETVPAEEAAPLLSAAQTERVIAIEDARRDPRISRELVERYNLKSLLIAPLRIKEELVGGISFNYHSKNVHFSPAQIDFAEKIAISLSLALENARLYARERTISLNLQEALLTSPPEIPGIVFSSLYEPARKEAKVGGDFFDLFELEHGRVGILIGDVSGKGVEAAALTALVKNAVRAFSYQKFMPVSVMAQVNDLIIAKAPGHLFVTAFFAILNTINHAMLYCCAGHPPAILKRRDKKVKKLTESSPALGILPGIGYKQHGIGLLPGDRLILYTDGIIEARVGSDLFGEDRLVEFVRDSTDPIEELPAKIFDEALRFSKGQLKDDVAILALKFK